MGDHGDRQREALAETRHLNIFPAERHQGRGLELGKPLSSLLLLLKARFDPVTPPGMGRLGPASFPWDYDPHNPRPWRGGPAPWPQGLPGVGVSWAGSGERKGRGWGSQRGAAPPGRAMAMEAAAGLAAEGPGRDRDRAALEGLRESLGVTLACLRGRAFGAASQEATKLSLAFSRPPLPSREEQERLAEGVQAAVLAAASVFYQLPKDQGTTLRRAVREATVEVVEGMIQLTEVILRTPLQSLSRDQLVSTGGVWEACDRVSSLPRDNQAAATLAISSCLGIVKDALEEMEQAQAEGGDPYGDVLEDEEVGSRGNKDVYWSEADRQLLGPCVGLVKAARACLKKVLGAVRAHGQAATLEQVAQLDDLADIAGDVSPSVDELVLSTYPPVNQLALRLNAGKLASVLKKMLEIARTSHVCPSPEEDWVRFLTGAVDHNMGRIKSLTQGLL
ncbi:cyclin-D1-binding protein 1 isoform X2 [Pogona vitticeps]